MSPRRPALLSLLVGCVALVTSCTPSGGPAVPEPSPVVPDTSTARSSSSPGSPRPSSPPEPSTPPEPSSPAAEPAPAEFETARVLRDIRRLAEDIGPREATSRNFAEAADLVQRRLSSYGLDIRRTAVRVPAGSSWGTPVDAGRSANVIAEPPGFDATEPHLVIGAHLDTVPTAPGAEDNASGVAVMLELARVAESRQLPLPVQLIAFGAEEPRGSGDAMHHFGSQQYVADLSRAERRAIVGMVALDRVGVRASEVPVCAGNDSGTDLRRRLRAAGRAADVPTRACRSVTSDHWSYAKVGVPAVRLGGVPYAGYHSPGDVPSVVDRRQLDRVGALMSAWLENPR